MNNYYYSRPKAPQRRFQNGRFENTHPYSNTISSSEVPCAPSRNDSQHELSQLAQRIPNVTHSTINSVDGSKRQHISNLVVGPGNPPRVKANPSWKGKCLKLIKNMLELEEAKPFHEPLNGKKYPGYYQLVPQPIDLSDIVKQFRNGHYQAPHEFASDVRLMFDNLKKYFKNPDSAIFIQIQKVSWWFESEYQRILSTLLTTPLPTHTAASPASTAASSPVFDTVTTKSATQPRPKSSSLLQGGRNISICVSNSLNAVESSSNSQLALTKSNRVVVLGSPLTATQSSCVDSPASPTAAVSLSSTTLLTSTSTTPTVTLGDKTKRVGHTALHRSGSSSGISRTPMSPNLSRPDIDSPSSPGSQPEPELELQIEVSNIWFGRARIKPQKALQLSENGFTMHLTKNGIVEPFHVLCEDIVKCMAHLGRNKKHTIFLFILPNCMKRLEAFNPRFANCSLVAIFAMKLATAQIGKLVHIFWLINKSSLFAPVFSEIDQKGALLLLSNIRPEMLKSSKHVQHIISDSTPVKKSSARSEESVVVVRSSSTSSVEETPSKSSSVTCTVTSAVASVQQSCHVSSTRQSVTTSTTNSMTTAVLASCGTSPMCLRTIPPCTNRTVSIGLTPIVTPTFGENALTISQTMRAHLGQSFTDNMQKFIQAKCNRITSASPGNSLQLPPVSSVVEMSSPAPTSSVNTSTTTPSVPTGGNTSSKTTNTAHPVLPPTLMEEEDDDLEIIDEFLIDSKDTVTHTPTGITNGDDVMMTSESMSIRCPITQMIMKRPMKNRHCGHSYDLEGVQELIRQRANKAKCPVLGCSNALPLRMEDMQRDEERWLLIQNKPS